MGRCNEAVSIPVLFVPITSSWKLKKAISFPRGPWAPDKVEAACREGGEGKSQKEKGREIERKSERKKERERKCVCVCV